jgi:sugar phosphate isomerase/epimerase
MTGIGLERLSLNQATVKHLSLPEAVALCGRHEIPAIGLWRDRVAEIGLAEAVAAARSAGLHVSSLCRGGFFTQTDPEGLAAARADNRAAVTEAAELGADTLILVCGGLVPGSRDLGLARRMVADAIGDLVPFAQQLGVRLGIEALHPMFCADRSVIASMGEAVDLALGFPAEVVGVVVDTYHIWWDRRLAAEIVRAAGRIVSYQVCDWTLPLPADALLGRGHLGDGVIDFGPISAAVTAAGYRGYVEVEIFNADVWDAPADQTAATVRQRFAAALGPDDGGLAVHQGKTPQPRYSRSYLTYRSGEAVSSARSWPASSSSGWASSQRRILSHCAATYRSQLSWLARTISTTLQPSSPNRPIRSGSGRKSSRPIAWQLSMVAWSGGSWRQYGSPISIMPPGRRLRRRSSTVPGRPPPIQVAPMHEARPTGSAAT